MKNYIEETYKQVRLQEGKRVIEQFLIQCYLNPGIPTKEVARKVLLPVPLATAIKKELIKAGALRQGSGIECTEGGNEYVESVLGYGGLDMELLQMLLHEGEVWKKELADLLAVMDEIFSARPQVDVLIDQSKCTVETSLHRAILCLRDQALLGKKVLCVGDDDLVSVSLGLLLKRLYPTGGKQTARIDVIDIDERFLSYIERVAAVNDLPITCHRADLRQPLPKRLHGKYDCFFTDPPYTLQGMSLFMSRGISALKKQKGLSIFLSFAHKSPDFTLAMQQEFVLAGVTVREVISHFNEYEGAQMIGNHGQMIVLSTTEMTMPRMPHAFRDALYTGEEKQTLRTYRCKRCDESVRVGSKGKMTTIEELKKRGCPRCKNKTFELISRKRL
ncbi:bis-aminopropyl spermidine synthase family protein [uncultured Brevibacillus sp.]|uniref:bis-aminopropyl spermidine synthase family protein n=1 Tax=uncultured Brevibacillus sp. TaxID=169970 RepID=UPI002596F71E|nr:bis-aminopropyl spermidine synthase family protein [uncultured Brevibacillus sp.]